MITKTITGANTKFFVELHQMNKINYSKLMIPRLGFPEDVAKQLISVQPMPDDLIKDVLDALEEPKAKDE